MDLPLRDSEGSVQGSALVQSQVLGIPQHKRRQISVNATPVDDVLKLTSVTGKWVLPLPLSPTPPASLLEPSTLFLPLLLHCSSLQLIPNTPPANLMREMEALEKKGHRSLAKPVKPSYNTPSRHKRSKSDLEEKNAKDAPPSSQKASNHPKPNGRNSNSHLQSETNKGIQPKSDTQDTLRKELERHLDDQQTVHDTLKKALGPNSAPVTLSNESPILKPTNQLIKGGCHTGAGDQAPGAVPRNIVHESI